MRKWVEYSRASLIWDILSAFLLISVMIINLAVRFRLRAFMLSAVVIMSMTLVSCGGGGGGSSTSGDPSTGPTIIDDKNPPAATLILSGTAATGAAIFPGHVSLKDSTGNDIDREADTDAEGHYEIDVTGLTPPFFLKIEFTDPVTKLPAELFSATNDPSGNANINELTHTAVLVAIAQAGGGVADPQVVFDNCADYADVMESHLDMAIESIMAFLAPVLEEFQAGDVNPLTDAFETNGLALDAVIHNGEIEISETGQLMFSLNDIPLGFANMEDLDDMMDDPDFGGLVCNRIEVIEVTDALIVVPAAVSGVGQIGPFCATLNLNVSSDGTGSLSYDFEEMYFAATAINPPSINNGVVTIRGSGTINGEATPHEFKASVKDGVTDKIGFEIDEIPSPVAAAGPIAITDGVGYTLSNGNVSGIGQTCLRATLNLDVSLTGGGSLRYDYEDNTIFEAVTIGAPTRQSSSGGTTVTIVGFGKLNGEAGHSFKATVKDGGMTAQWLHVAVNNGSDDAMGFEIDGVAAPVPSNGPLPLIGGSFTISE
ncbi:MAG: hypothetical protein HZA16_08985 [Nitrospirae bacterium]|nr:hypothetical protein [Nitrospirota bacterium]